MFFTLNLSTLIGDICPRLEFLLCGLYHIAKIIKTYQFRKEEDRYSKRISMERIAEEAYNLNISRYISTAVAEDEIVLEDTHADLVRIEEDIQKATRKHNEFLKELGQRLLPTAE